MHIFKKKWLEFSIIRGKHEIRPQHGPNFSCSNIQIMYNTANNAVNYIQIFIVKNSARC